MKFHALICLSVLFYNLRAQDTLFSTEHNNWVKSPINENYNLKRVLLKENKLWSVSEYDSSNTLIMKGSYTSKKCKKEQGDFKFFYPNGNLSSQGIYSKGDKIGEWKFYFKNGNLSAKEYFVKGFIDSVSCWNRDGTKNNDIKTVYHFLSFPFGSDSLDDFILENFKVPDFALEKPGEINVVINFDVLESGRISSFKVFQSSGSKEIDNEALRVASLIKEFNPAYKHCIPIKSVVSLPFNVIIR